MTDPDYVMPYQLNFTGREAFTAIRGRNGCDWLSVQPKRKLEPNAESYFYGEKHESTCTGVFYFTYIPPEYRVGAPPRTPRPGETMSVSIAVGADVWEGPDTLTGRGRQARDIANAVVAAAPEGIRLEHMNIADDSLAFVAVVTRGFRGRYGLRFRSGKWVVVGKPTPF